MGKEFSIGPRDVARVETKYRRIATKLPHPDSVPTLEKLRGDFPGLNISKIRFLEAEGLIEPERTPSGYRKFSHQDVERLRYVLTCQREHYLPLKVIREHLDAIDRGLEPPALNGASGPQVPRVVLDGDGYPAAESFGSDTSGLRLSRNELLTTAQIEDGLLEQLETYGLVTPRPGSSHRSAP
jgi:DNA-binding transcriptional MerR regulator